MCPGILLVTLLKLKRSWDVWMINSFNCRRVFLGFVALFAMVIPLSAEENMKSISIWGGWYYTDGSGVEGFSIGAEPIAPPVLNHFVGNPDQGRFFGAALGVPINLPNTSFNHIEIYFEGKIDSQDKSTGFGTSAFIPGINEIINGFASGGPIGSASARLDRNRFEFGTVLTASANGLENMLFNLSLTPFVGFGSEEAQSQVFLPNQPNPMNTTKFDTDWYFGGMLAGARHKVPLAESVDFILKGEGGFYYFNADADYSDTFSRGTNYLTDQMDGVGFRARARAELRTELNDGLFLALFAEADYWSDVPYSKLSNPAVCCAASQSAAYIDVDGVLDLKVGLKLIIPLSK